MFCPLASSPDAARALCQLCQQLSRVSALHALCHVQEALHDDAKGTEEGDGDSDDVDDLDDYIKELDKGQLLGCIS